MKVKRRLVLAFLAAVVGCSRPPAPNPPPESSRPVDTRSIREALEAEAAMRDKPLSEIPAALRKIDLRKCPEDFVEAFLKLIHLYEQAGSLGWNGSTKPAPKDLLQFASLWADAGAAKKLSSDIHGGQLEVERIALKHGVQAGMGQ
jgi:hypothetical protein